MDEPETGSPWRAVLRGGGARVAVLAISLVLGLIITRWIITKYGEGTYAQYGLLVGLAALLPFSDLGIGAAVMNAVGESPDPRHDDHVRQVLLTSIRGLTMSALVIGTASLIITLGGWWPALLGEALDEQYGNLAAGMCLIVFAMTIPVAVGQRILVGLHRNHVAVGLSGLQSPIVLLALVAVSGFGAWAGAFVPVVSYVALFVIAVIALWLSMRLIGPTLGPAFRQVPRLRQVRGAPAAHTALPMLVMTIALPLGYQTSRIVLSHVSTQEALAQYNMAAQLFTPLRLVVNAAGMSLWAHFARARSAQENASPFSLSAAFGAVAAGVCLAVSLASPVIVQFASDGLIQLDVPTLVFFSGLTVGLALTYPIGMYLNDPVGLRIQAIGTVVVLPVTIALSVTLAAPMGAAGPVLAALTMTVALLAWQTWYAWRRVRRGSPA